MRTIYLFSKEIEWSFYQKKVNVIIHEKFLFIYFSLILFLRDVLHQENVTEQKRNNFIYLQSFETNSRGSSSNVNLKNDWFYQIFNEDDFFLKITESYKK